MAGTRCLLGEVHALVSTGFLGSAKRRASGLDSSRLAMLIAVLEKHGGLRLADQDVFAQALGGLKIAEPAADLSIALAVAGAFLHRTLPHGTVAIGEVGLTGELRTVPHLEQRVHESLRRGARVVLVPSSAKIGANVERDARNEQRDIVKVGTIQRALDVLTPVQRALTEGRSTSDALGAAKNAMGSAKDALGAAERGARTPPAEFAEPKAGVKRRG
jgi:predicted ATP-dependent serine protease